MYPENENHTTYTPVKIDLDDIKEVEDVSEEAILQDASVVIKEEQKEKERQEQEQRATMAAAVTGSDDFEEDIPDRNRRTSGKKQKRPKTKGGFFAKVLLAIAIVILAIGGTFAYSLWGEYSNTNSKEGEVVEVNIEEGASSKKIAKLLKEKGLIRYEVTFLAKLRNSEYAGKLRYGIYDLHKGMCLGDIIETLATTNGKETRKKFTAPEGYSVEMLAKKIEKEGLMTGEEFLAAVEKAADGFVYADQLPTEDVFYRLQGFLYPDTYYIEEETTADDLVAMMLQEFVDQYDADRQTKARELGLDLFELITRASIVEKETINPEEYPMVAGVVENRLAENMRLQMDSTVVYAKTNGEYGMERVLYKDLEYESPYNTYLNDGLPVGPICNPSIEAVDGVLNYVKHEYLFFQTDLVKNDGSNLYFDNYEDHKAASDTAQEIITKRKQEEDGETEKSSEKVTLEAASSEEKTKDTTKTKETTKKK